MTSLVGYVLWLLAPAVQVYLIVVMKRRGLHREFPIFFGYTVFQILSFVLQFAARHASSYTTYFFVYWVTAVIGVGIAFAVVHEIFDQVFRPYDSLRELGGILFKWAALVLVLVAMVSAAGGPQPGSQRVMATVLLLDRTVRVMQCGLVLFLFLFSGFVGLSKRSHIFGIALGFGIFAAIDLSMVTLRSAFGVLGNEQFSLLKSLAYNLSCGLWLWYLRAPEPERVVIDQRARGRDWNLALGTIAQPQESFLPMIETMVERVLERREATTAKP
ncbi:MAG: hypothetical protein ACE14L_11000 [Terriglobales bacterium]